MASYLIQPAGLLKKTAPAIGFKTPAGASAKLKKMTRKVILSFCTLWGGVGTAAGAVLSGGLDFSLSLSLHQGKESKEQSF